MSAIYDEFFFLVMFLIVCLIQHSCGYVYPVILLSFFFSIEVFLKMTSLFIGEQEETLFLLHEQPPTILQQSESLDGIKSMQQILSASSSITSTLPNQQQQNSRPLLSSNELIPPPLRFSSNQSRFTNSNDSDSFVRQFERRLDEHRILSQKDYDRKIQQMIETKNNEFEGLKLRYESKLNEFEENNRQLEIQLGQINEENKRLKIELEHEKQQNKLEYVKTKNDFLEKNSIFLLFR